MPFPKQFAAEVCALLELALLLRAESRRPQRAPREARAVRWARNGALGGVAVATSALLETPLVLRAAAAVERNRFGILQRLPLPPSVRTALAILSLDYGMYWWHVALHRMSLLWRLHLVHHVDRDLDVTTAARIHVVEIFLSLLVRLVQVTMFGITPRQFVLWQGLFTCSLLFQHANVRLRARDEGVLGALLMTPRRHAIHHLARPDAQDGNFSSGLILWDRLHGTIREGDPAGDIGVPAFRRPADVTLARLFALPFGPQRNVWIQA